jgi:SAM-dependent methyltransferase
MTQPTYDQAFWEQLWTKTLHEHADKVTARAPNTQLVSALASVPPGRALDAGCGHGAESLWLATQGWNVTAVDFSGSALAHGRAMADALGASVSGRITWIEGDLATWIAPSCHFDLVVSLYVHVAGPVKAAIQKLGDAVAVGGTLLMIGHRPIDPATGAPTPAAGQVQISVDDAIAVLDREHWELLVAEERPRAVAGSGVDAVIRARRLA